MKPLQIEVQSDEERVACLSLSGFLDAHTVQAFEQDVTNTLSEERLGIILDIGELNYISSAGIGAMMGLAQRLRKKGGVLVLLKPSDKVYRILDTLGFTKIFKIEQEEEEARRVVEALA